MKYDVLVVGAGPGGLRCAKLLAEQGARVLILERGKVIGAKVCAGGITMGGLLKRIPDTLIERSFDHQTITTRKQTVILSSDEPMLATLDRKKLGNYLACQALEKGAHLLTGARLTSLSKGKAVYCLGNKNHPITYQYLVGADGSQSRVRSYLRLPTVRVGYGLNYWIPKHSEEMVWNFDADRFGSGYSWIFPHLEHVSAGAYLAYNSISARVLNKNLLAWLQENRLDSETTKPQAGRINFDFRGYRFDNIFLVGDAAGLASPLTGEGIFPAIISAEAVAQSISEPDLKQYELLNLLKKHHKHGIMLRLAARSKLLANILAELSAWLLKRRLLSFSEFEMA